MHYAPRTQILRVSCYMNLLIVWKAFLEKMSSVRTALANRSKKKISSLQTTQAIHLRKIVFRSNTLGYPLDKEISSLRMTQANPFEKNCHPFERLELSVGKSFHPLEENCHPF